MITRERLNELRALAEKATDGPWRVIHQKDEFNEAYWIGPEEYFSIAEVRNGADDEEYGGTETEVANATFIAASRAAAPDLIETIEALARGLERAASRLTAIAGAAAEARMPGLEKQASQWAVEAYTLLAQLDPQPAPSTREPAESGSETVWRGQWRCMECGLPPNECECTWACGHSAGQPK